MSRPSMGKKMRHGAVWMTSGQISGQMLTFVSGVVLARLLFPEDYGLKAMAVTASSLVAVIGSVGTDTMLIQQDENFDKYANAGLRLNVFIGMCLFIIQLAVAPFVAHFYGNIKVMHLLMVSAIGYLIAPFGSIHRTILIKKMEFGKKTIVDITRFVLTSLLSILLAVVGMGVWSFIIPPILVAFIEVPLLWYMEPWRPCKGSTLEYWKPIFRFGKNILGTNVLWYIENSVDYLLIGKFLSLKALGIYYFAFEKSFGMVSRFLKVSGGLSFPAFSNLKADPLEFRESFFKYASLLSLVAFPFIFLLSSTGPEFIHVIFGAKWSDAILPFVLLSFSTIFRPIGDLCYQIANAAGRPDFSFKWKLITVPINTVAILIGLQFGIIGIAVATFFYRTISIPIYAALCMRLLGWEAKALLKAITPALISGLLMLFVILLFKVNLPRWICLPPLLKLFVFSITGIVSYVLSLRLLFRDEFQKLIVQIRRFLPKPLKASYASE